MTYLLDSSVLIRFFQKKEDAISLVTELQSKGELAASVMSVAELRAGWSDAQTQQLLPFLYKLIFIVDVNKEIAELSGRLRHIYRPKGKTLHTVDTIIAATAIVNEFSLATFDHDFYPISEVSIYSK